MRHTQWTQCGRHDNLRRKIWQIQQLWRRAFEVGLLRREAFACIATGHSAADEQLMGVSVNLAITLIWGDGQCSCSSIFSPPTLVPWRMLRSTGNFCQNRHIARPRRVSGIRQNVSISRFRQCVLKARIDQCLLCQVMGGFVAGTMHD